MNRKKVLFAHIKTNLEALLRKLENVQDKMKVFIKLDLVKVVLSVGVVFSVFNVLHDVLISLSPVSV